MKKYILKGDKKIKIIAVVGARPNFIKIAPFASAIKNKKIFDFIIVHTGQHYDYEMSKFFFKELKIPVPDYNLNIGSAPHAIQTGKIMMGLEPIFIKEKPDIVVVFGDVNSTLAGALTAAKLNIKICHIESGLRSYDRRMPEEINRVLTDRISDFLFCPTKTAVNNLKKEGIIKGVYNTGDLMYDIFLENIKKIKKQPEMLKKMGISPKDYLLLTIHRSSNTDNPKKLKEIIEIIIKSKENIIFPCHPRTKSKIKDLDLSKFNNIKIISPLGYLEMINLEKNAKKIITDSGGVQKEAYWLKAPCITLRDNTEWNETLKDKWNILVGFDKAKITKAISGFNPAGKQNRHFGSGNTAKKMVEILHEEGLQIVKNIL